MSWMRNVSEESRPLCSNGLTAQRRFLRSFILSPRSNGRAPGRASSVWRRGWAFEVAFAETAHAPTEGARPPRTLPTRGNLSPRPHCSNPTLSGRLFCGGLLVENSVSSIHSYCYGGEGGIRTHGRVTPTAVFETARFGRSRTSPFVVVPEAPAGWRETLASASRLGRELTVGRKFFQLLFFRLSTRYDELVHPPCCLAGAL